LSESQKSQSHQRRGALGGLTRVKAEPERIEEARSELKYVTATDYVRRLVDDLPPLTELQRARLATLLLSGPGREGADAA
jgi:hypothetical protein